ncbi:MAG: ABC transporter ATP-binding protein [Oscillospiraceae bacterium]|nr:ABC transporter ATP-binding protein [Oscillospiraceae bacterium]
MAYIEMKDVTRVYETGDVRISALDGVDLQIEQGELAIIVGPSGAGKTTLLNLLGGMDTASSGSILIDGKEIVGLHGRELTKFRRYDVGFVFQFYNLVGNLTALENVELASQICRDPMPAAEALKKVGLGHRLQNFPAQLSGGEQQRVAIARALAKRPKLLLCDEPTGALDYVTGKEVLRLLQDTCRQDGMTVLIITHNSALMPMGDRVIRLRSGKVLESWVNGIPTEVERIEW